MKDTGGREWRTSGLYKSMRVVDEPKVKRSSSIPPTPRASMQSGLKKGLHELQPRFQYTDSSAKQMQSTQADSTAYAAAQDVTDYLMMSPTTPSVPSSPLRTSKVSKFTTPSTLVSTPIAMFSTAKPLAQKKKTKKKKATKTQPGAPVYGSRITNKYPLRGDVEHKVFRKQADVRLINNITNPPEPVYPRKNMVKPKKVIDVKGSAWGRFLDGTPAKFEIKDRKPALGACSLAYLRGSDRQYTDNMKRQIIKRTDSIQHLIKGKGATAAYQKAMYEKAQANMNLQRLQSARAFEVQYGNQVEDLFASGMGTPQPANHDVGVITSRLGQSAGKGAQKHSSQLRDKQHRDSTLNLFAKDDSAHQDFRDSSEGQRVSYLNKGYLSILNQSRSLNKVNSARALYQTHMYATQPFATTPKDESHNFMSDCASERSGRSRSSLSSYRDTVGSFGRRNLLNRVAQNGDQIVESTREKSLSGSQQRRQTDMRSNFGLA